MRILVLMLRLLLAVANADVVHLSPRERFIITVDLLRQSDLDTEDFAISQRMVIADINAIYTELEKPHSNRTVLEQHFFRLHRSMDLLGETAGCTSHYARSIEGNRSLDQYNAVRDHIKK